MVMSRDCGDPPFVSKNRVYFSLYAQVDSQQTLMMCALSSRNRIEDGRNNTTHSSGGEASRYLSVS